MSSIKIGNIEIGGRLALAPMAGVTDLACRTICREFGAALCYTEMVSARALVYQDSKTRRLLTTNDADHPLGVQIFGNDPAIMADAAGRALEISGADFVDINMGCPVEKIVKSGDGCALMRTPELAGDIIEAVCRAIQVPVTVKIRKGWNRESINAVPFAQMAESAGAAAITVHGRTRTQMYSGRADWDSIRAVKAAVHVPVIANGDVFTGADAAAILSHTGADMAMVGRGCFGNPWIFEQGNAALHGTPPPPMPSMQARVNTALRQIELALTEKGERPGCLEARKHLAWYLKGIPNGAKLRQLATGIESRADLYRVTEKILETPGCMDNNQSKTKGK